MKKIFSILLCSALIFSILCVSVSAAGPLSPGVSGEGSEHVITNLTGTTWSFPDTITDYETTFSYSVDFDFEIVSDNPKYGYGNNLKLTQASNGTYYFSGQVSFIDPVTGEYTGSANGLYVGYKKAPTLSSTYTSGFQAFKITFTGGADVTNPDLIAWIKQYSLDYTTVCDGETCPVADADANGICDTCGMAVLTRVRVPEPPSNWPELFPMPPGGYDGISKYVLIQPPELPLTQKLYVFTPYEETPVAIWDTTGNPNDRIQVRMYDADANPVNVKRFTYTLNNGEWSLIDSQVVDSTLMGSFSSTIYYSSFTLYNADGTLFFPQPLWTEVGQVAQGEMPTFLTILGQNLTPILLCGIGLLALVIGLYLLLRVLRTYLKR